MSKNCGDAQRPQYSSYSQQQLGMENVAKMRVRQMRCKKLHGIPDTDMLANMSPGYYPKMVPGVQFVWESKPGMPNRNESCFQNQKRTHDAEDLSSFQQINPEKRESEYSSEISEEAGNLARSISGPPRKSFGAEKERGFNKNRDRMQMNQNGLPLPPKYRRTLSGFVGERFHRAAPKSGRSRSISGSSSGAINLLLSPFADCSRKSSRSKSSWSRQHRRSPTPTKRGFL